MDFSKKKGYFCSAFAAILWGVSGSAAQYLFQDANFNVDWLTSIRLLLSGTILLLISFVLKKGLVFDVWRSKDSAIRMLIFGAVGMLGIQYTYFSAIKNSNAATATILQYLSPIFIACYFAFITRKKPHNKEIMAIAIAIIGTFFIITKGSFSSIVISQKAFFWGIAAAIMSAFYSIFPKKLIVKYEAEAIIGWAMVIGGVVISFVHSPFDFIGICDINSILAFAFVIFFGTIIPFYLYLVSLKYVKPLVANLLTSFEPISAVVLSIIWLNTKMDGIQILGILFIISAVFLLSLVKDETVV